MTLTLKLHHCYFDTPCPSLCETSFRFDTNLLSVISQSAQWISQFTAGALEMVKTGKSTIAPKISQIAPLTWVSLRSAAPYKGRLSMNDLLQLVEVIIVCNLPTSILICTNYVKIHSL
jgi:hypothetical protein